MSDRADVVLRGHLHDPEVEFWSDPDRRLPHFAAGCLYESDQADTYPNSLQVLTLELDHAGRLTRGTARFRSWSSRGHWHDDNSLYRETQNGRLNWTLPERPVQAGAAARNPYSPWVEAKPPRFAGRTAVLRQLDTALEERRSVSIVGDRRIGKSSLLTTFALTAEKKGRAVRPLSGQRREGASIDAFVNVVTGLTSPQSADAAADLLERWADMTGLPGLPPVLVVDEFDDMLGRFDDRFFERLRGMLGKIVLVVATRAPIDLIYRRLGRTSPFENQLQLRRLGLLELAAAETIIGWGRPTLQENDALMMREEAGCHPCFLQLLGHHLFSARQHGDSLGEALSAFRFEAAARLREVWRGLDDVEHRALMTLARGKNVTRGTLIERGLILSDGRPFGAVLIRWLTEFSE